MLFKGDAFMTQRNTFQARRVDHAPAVLRSLLLVLFLLGSTFPIAADSGFDPILGDARVRGLDLTRTVRIVGLQASPPASHQSGDVYLVTGPASGAWAGQEDKWAISGGTGNPWAFETPDAGDHSYAVGFGRELVHTLVNQGLDGIYPGSSVKELGRGQRAAYRFLSPKGPVHSLATEDYRQPINVLSIGNLAQHTDLELPDPQTILGTQLILVLRDETFDLTLQVPDGFQINFDPSLTLSTTGVRVAHLVAEVSGYVNVAPEP